jgi:hypothetical protein
MCIRRFAIAIALLFSLNSPEAWTQAFTAVSKRIQTPTRASETPNTQAPTSLMNLSGPILGLIFDSSKSGLRPIYGIPGASRLGKVWVLGREIQRAWISSLQDYALVESKSDGSLALVSFGKGAILIRSIKGVAGGVGNISLSTKGGVAALYYPTARRVQFVSGLPDTPQVSSFIAFPGIPQSETAMAVSDDGEAVLLATTEQHGALVLLTRDGQSRVLTLLGKASSISFFPGTHNALVADEQSNAVLLVQDVTGAAITSTLAGSREGIGRPVAVEASEDNRFAFVANGDSHTISTLDLHSGKVSSLTCNCTPTGLYRLSGNSVFRLNELSDANLQVLDARAAEPRVLFVPADANRTGLAGGTVPDRGQSRPIQTRPAKSTQEGLLRR